MTDDAAGMPPRRTATARRPSRVLASVAGAGLLAGFLAMTAQASLLSQRLFLEVRLPVLLAAAALAIPGWLVLVLAARGRVAPWRWLAVATAWGLFATAALSIVGEAVLANLLGPALAWLAQSGRTIAEAVPAMVIAPLIEEPVKALGVLIALRGIQRAGTQLGVALGAAVGGLVGLASGVTESAHHIGEFVNELGYIDLSGVFVVDWDLVRRLAEVQVVEEQILFGLTNHALFSALAGVGIAQLLAGHRRSFAAWFLLALLGHAIYNSVGLGVGTWLYGALIGSPTVGQVSLVPPLLAAWLAAGSSFLVAEAWVAVLLVRRLRRPDADPPAYRERRTHIGNVH